MKGTYRIVVQNKKIKYDFELKRNITVIRGDSATGKTALVDMIREYYENGSDSGIQLSCDKECAVLEGRNWQSQLSLLNDCIIFIDEGNAFTSSKEFASAIQQTDNYYVVVTRERLAALPYSVKEIYGIRNSGKYGRLNQTYNEFYNIYNLDTYTTEILPDIIMTEDANSGYQFFDDVSKKNDLVCISAEGKSNILKKMKEYPNKKILIIADGAAFGPEMERVMMQINVQRNITLYLPESFEWIILNSGIIKDSEIFEILENPSQYIDSKQFFSWERFFTHVLIEKTSKSYLKYTKTVLNPAYLEEHIEKKVLEQMVLINLKWNK